MINAKKGILLDVLFVIDLRKDLVYLGKVVNERVAAMMMYIKSYHNLAVFIAFKN